MIFLGLHGRQPMRAKGESVSLLTRLWLVAHGFKRFTEDPDGGPLWVNLNTGAFFAPRTAEELATAEARQREAQEKAQAEANERGDGPRQQGRIIPAGMIPRKH